MFYGHRVFLIQVIYFLTKWLFLYYCLISTSSSFWFIYWASHESKSKPKQLNQSVTITLEYLRRTGCYNISNETTSVILYIYEVHSDIKMLRRYLNLWTAHETHNMYGTHITLRTSPPKKERMWVYLDWRYCVITATEPTNIQYFYLELVCLSLKKIVHTQWLVRLWRSNVFHMVSRWCFLSEGTLNQPQSHANSPGREMDFQILLVTKWSLFMPFTKQLLNSICSVIICQNWPGTNWIVLCRSKRFIFHQTARVLELFFIYLGIFDYFMFKVACI